ncbi:hypothetical protein CI109_100629 [Kwoniella shandongensis]|uniref:Uncharacterized protein n=1 Tax=Kwoniella shandongensis TaxID=1734106 RepID=A0A5M6C0F3_9TREE|nr:uncharacterized protein CI109_003449 [Kwoniella shandongensis]KAA5528161.1 hypothetical protein CI109_003449 [Kwoniella shandongensis]
MPANYKFKCLWPGCDRFLPVTSCSSGMAMYSLSNTVPVPNSNNGRSNLRSRSRARASTPHRSKRGDKNGFKSKRYLVRLARAGVSTSHVDVDQCSVIDLRSPSPSPDNPTQVTATPPNRHCRPPSRAQNVSSLMERNHFATIERDGSDILLSPDTSDDELPPPSNLLSGHPPYATGRLANKARMIISSEYPPPREISATYSRSHQHRQLSLSPDTPPPEHDQHTTVLTPCEHSEIPATASAPCQRRPRWVVATPTPPPKESNIQRGSPSTTSCPDDDIAMEIAAREQYGNDQTRLSDADDEDDLDVREVRERFEHSKNHPEEVDELDLTDEERPTTPTTPRSVPNAILEANLTSLLADGVCVARCHREDAQAEHIPITPIRKEHNIVLSDTDTDNGMIDSQLTSTSPQIPRRPSRSFRSMEDDISPFTSLWRIVPRCGTTYQTPHAAQPTSPCPLPSTTEIEKMDSIEWDLGRRRNALDRFIYAAKNALVEDSFSTHFPSQTPESPQRGQDRIKHHVSLGMETNDRAVFPPTGYNTSCARVKSNSRLEGDETTKCDESERANLVAMATHVLICSTAQLSSPIYDTGVASEKCEQWIDVERTRGLATELLDLMSSLQEEGKEVGGSLLEGRTLNHGSSLVKTLATIWGVEQR